MKKIIHYASLLKSNKKVVHTYPINIATWSKKYINNIFYEGEVLNVKNEKNN